MSAFLTKEELTILSRGLELYETEPIHTGMMTSIIGSVILSGHRSETEAKAAVERDIKKASDESDKRKLSVARLKVKLMEMAMQPSEFSQ